jgi:hypothetical protein
MKKDEMTNDLEKEFGQLFSNRELNDAECAKRAEEIENYLINHGGIIMAASCQEGILLVSANPQDEKGIFQVYHRIALLGRGRAKDCHEIHRLALSSASITGITLSKADINVKDIVKGISEELDSNFSYFRSRRGPYKADFMVLELGFSPEEDSFNLINFFGGLSFKEQSSQSHLGIIETPIVHRVITTQKRPIKNQEGQFEKDEKGQIKTQDVPCLVARFSRPVTFGLFASIGDRAESRGIITSIRELALFVGLMFRLLDERMGSLEMVYLDREMLKKTKSEERRFHHIWQRITNPNPNKPTDSWQDWKRFVAPAYKKAKEGKISSKLKILIDFYEIFEKELDPNQGDLLKKMELRQIYLANYNFVMNLFASESKKEDGDNK